MLRHCLLLTALIAACGKPAAPTATPTAAAIANPASKHCAEVGGRLAIEKTPRGAEYGVCSFEDNRQCEEWALLRGECPVGGRKITGYLTAAARYCAITGGRYEITAGSGAENEQGTCTLSSGKICSADAYLNGECTR
jgi:hypothetical protein